MSQISYQVLGAFTSFFAFTSVIGACYIIYGAIKVRRSLIGKPSKTRPLFVVNHVLWMSVCDVMQQFWIGFVWLPIGFNTEWNANWSSISCSIWGTFGQFFLVSSASWNFIIAICLLRMLMATPIYKLEDEILYHHLSVWIISFICTIIPWFGNAYGYAPNIEHQYGFADFECWIQEKNYQLCLYLPAMVYVFFAALLLIFTFIRNKKIQRISMSLRLIAYTIVFVVTWTFPIALRLRQLSTDQPPHAFAVWGHHIMLGSIGIGNAVIWGTSKQIKEATSSSTRSVTSSKKSKSPKTSTAKRNMSNTIELQNHQSTADMDRNEEFYATDTMRERNALEPVMTNNETVFPPVTPVLDTGNSSQDLCKRTTESNVAIPIQSDFKG